MDDGGGLRAGKNTGCNSNTVKAFGLKKKPSELKYFQVSRGGHLTSRCTCQLASRHTCQLTSRHICQLTSRHTSRIACQLIGHLTRYPTCHFQVYE